MDERTRNLLDEIRYRIEGYDPIYNVQEERKPQIIHDGIPFRIPVEPLQLRYNTLEDIKYLGKAIWKFIRAVIELYEQDEKAKELLDRSKPDYMKGLKEALYLFLRLDLGLTREGGVCIYEIDNTLYGMAILDILNRSYAAQGYGDILLPENTLKNYIESQLNEEGTLVGSNYGERNKKQIEYLAEEIFSTEDKKWNFQTAGEDESRIRDLIYMAFREWEVEFDKDVYNVVRSGKKLLPGLAPQLVEKAVLALFWDRRFEKFFRKNLGTGSFNFLKRVIPPTCIVGEERYFGMGMPDGVNEILDLASLPSGERLFVLKVSGYKKEASWSKGVWFLSELSQEQCLEALKNAIEDKDHLYVLQVFNKGVKRKISYVGKDGNSIVMPSIVRLSVYYDTKGKLCTIGFTGCETSRVHAMTTAIIGPVAEKEKPFKEVVNSS